MISGSSGQNFSQTKQLYQQGFYTQQNFYQTQNGTSQGINQNTFEFSNKQGPNIQNYGNKTAEGTGSNFKVVVRVRPPLPREMEGGNFISTVGQDHKKITIYEYYNIEAIDPAQAKEYYESTNMFTMHAFTFDWVYDQDSTQTDVYENTAKPAVLSTLKGYNATILAYGQTGTGKTYTMEGFKYNSLDPQRGIIPRAMEEIFKYIENISNSKTTFMVRASYLQIYNEVISDLLRSDRSNLHIREDKKKGVFVDGLSEWAVRSPNEIYSLMQKGAMSRATASTKMNDVSSRSHAVFIIIVEQMSSIEGEIHENGPKEIKVGKLNLVDLAGSERVRVTGATGKRLEECKKINQSLSALGNVIAALTDKQPKSHIPYRDSKITRILEDSLGGNCITTMMAMLSPAQEAFGESLSSLKFANRAKNIRNEPIINEDVDQKALLRKYEVELTRLRAELEGKNKHLLDKNRVLQLEEDKKRAEQDKAAAMSALEARSKEFIQEREEKKKLEEKIRAMNSQVLVGGRKIEDTPQFRSALEEQQKLIRQQYEVRLQDLEKERQQIEEDKAQVDRYKQLLLKQRDIMIALTTRLNERDETIIQLQEELDAYDRIHRETEDILEIKTQRVTQLEAILREKKIPFPKEELNGSPSNTQKTLNKTQPEIVKYDGQETYNVTQSNLGNAGGRIIELTQIAEEQKNEIFRLKSELESIKNGEETNEFVKNEIMLLNGKVKKYEESQQNLREIIKKKGEILNDEIKHIKETRGPLNGLQKDIKHTLDTIIDCLSSENEPYKLQNVAQELLTLQKLVNTWVTPQPEKELSQPQYSKTMSNFNKVNSPTSVARPTAGAPLLTSLYAESRNFVDSNPKTILQSRNHNSVGLNQKDMGTFDFPGRKSETPSSSLKPAVFDNIVNINPTRQAMTVEQMLQLKRTETSKKK